MFVVTIFQLSRYEHLQILICNGNSLTSLAGIENLKHLWKLDVANNQVEIEMPSGKRLDRTSLFLRRFEAFNTYRVSSPWAR